MGSSTQWALRPAGAGTRTPCSAEWRGRMVTVCREGGSLPETPPWPWRQLPEPEMPRSHGSWRGPSRHVPT
jgi:hypothetical protein